MISEHKKILPYSEWKRINLKPRKNRHAKKFNDRYEDFHPRYTDYCFRIARSKEPQGKRRGISVHIMDAAFRSAITDVMLVRAVYGRQR